ncbi:MAG: lipopolysaccharide transport system ATP-binding protein [Alphaproteobacteria bacterium]|jgi:ABC-2 type transport system ATP-binding protein/lipopolysaccharide transport system ATP-binding protein|nr:lipopolysaccharide transport system ATP-binding protein [Alphaproteobacteria bacterium]
MSYIHLDRVSVEIPIYSGLDRSLKLSLFRSAAGTGLLRSAGGTIGRDRRDRIVIRALDEITLQISDGDRIALIGRNGAGKTTLLRVLADVMEPVSGTIKISGRVSTLFNVSGLMDPELPGYDNVFFAGGLIGISRSRLKKLMPDIEAFAELGDYLRMPVRTYSAGMMIRLGFAIATCIDPDILLMDEVIGAGDTHFVDKAIRRAQELYKQSNILIAASHSPTLLQGLCNKAILLEGGKVVSMGSFESVTKFYEDNPWSAGTAPQQAAE